MILYRAFSWDETAAADVRGGPLWFPRRLQGAGRHDNPGLYGCLYVSERPLSPLVERLARFRGRTLTAEKLVGEALPTALATLVLDDAAKLLDLDEPAVLEREGLRPSHVATSDRSLTREAAARLFDSHPGASGVRWPSAFEALWTNVTLYDRAAALLEVEEVRPLGLGDDVVLEAADYLGLPVSN